MNRTVHESLDRDGTVDIIGARVLSGVQMAWISRLSTHPLPLVSSGLITVAGQGPSDSNGAGKSSFIAAISLLCGDEQWRWGGGAKAAAELLFTAEVAAQEHRYTNAGHGYVIGVFTDPAATTEAALYASAITVWLKINRAAPYIDLRWDEGLRLAAGQSETERVDALDEIWSSLKKRGTSGDVHASTFNQTMYGDSVRSVSFLSTSVRASHTPNLLAQPLNELTPERIFDAVAALTGLDRELEHEREYRTIEHERQVRHEEVLQTIQRWEAEAQRIEKAVAERGQARAEVERTRHQWKGQCARAIVDGADRLDEIRSDLKELTVTHEGLVGEQETIKEQLRGLEDDDAFNQRCAAAQRQWEQASEAKSDLEANSRRLISEIGQRQEESNRLADTARTSDGRTVAQASEELDAAQKNVEDARVAEGVADERTKAAQAALEAAEQGRARGAAGLDRLAAAGIQAAALLDTLDLNERDRAAWEPRLSPFEEAVIVADKDFDFALELLQDLPGTILAAADPDGIALDGKQLPQQVDTRFGATALLEALQSRAGNDNRFTDMLTRTRVVGGFTEPITGRTARIRIARAALEAAAGQRKEAQVKVEAAERGKRLAQTRLGGAEAAERISELDAKIEAAREQIDANQEALDRNQPAWEKAKQHYTEALRDQGQRDAEIRRLERASDLLDKDIDQNLAQRTQLQEEAERIDMDDLLEAFDGRDPDDARRHLMALAHEQERHWTFEEWQEATLESLENALARCFPPGTHENAVPQSIREWHWNPAEARIRRNSPAAGATAELLAAVNSHLMTHEHHDQFEANRIAQERLAHDKHLAGAQQGFNEAAQAASAHRSSLAKGITATLKEVARHFNDLDRAYGGYGADLDFTEPEPPSEPDRPWRWALTPKWSRAEGQRPAGYKLKGNTAQVEEKAIKLVCAAALAGGSERPLMLILDELGRNLGKQHRRDAVALFEAIGKDRNITVIGALQDDMERYAIEASGLFIKLRRSSDTQPYNDPPAIVGHDEHADRVRLLQSWLETGHLLAGRPGEADRTR